MSTNTHDDDADGWTVVPSTTARATAARQVARGAPSTSPSTAQGEDEDEGSMHLPEPDRVLLHKWKQQQRDLRQRVIESDAHTVCHTHTLVCAAC